MKKSLKDLVDWQSLGLELGFFYLTLKRVKKEQHGDIISDCMREMPLEAWLQQQDNVTSKGVPSWSVLQTVFRSIGENEVASEISTER